jgi:L-asparaginase/Glu-tRNA(Gln) amidotransferase subunit D
MADRRQVLIIHTGGTIGMFKDQNGKFEPRKDRFEEFLRTYPYFHDEHETYFMASDGFTITPETIFKSKIWYKYCELDQLLDSTNMTVPRINIILQALEANYHRT